MDRPFTSVLRVGLLLTVVAGLIPLATPPADATRGVERVLYRWACDDVPETLVFADPLGDAGPESLEERTVLGARVSPDGTRIALTVWDGIQIARADGSGGIDVADGSYPAWSPAGDRIAYVGLHDGTGHIMILTVDSEREPVAVLPIGDGIQTSGLDWSPDGEHIAWSRSTTTGGPVIDVVRIADGTTEFSVHGTDARYSPDGSRIAYEAAGFLATMVADGTGQSITGQSGRTPVWSPDGGSVAFVDRRAAPGETTGDLISYVGIYTPATGTVSAIVEGTIACDDSFSVEDWAVLQWPTFVDAAFDHTFYGDIEWLAAEGITKGCNPPLNTEFCPETNVTRGQMAAFLVRALGLTDRLDDPFVDDDDSIFEADIERLAAAGITKGCNPPDNDRFCPDGKMTREEMAAFLVRALGYTDDGGGDLFVDDDDSIFEGDIDRLGTAGVTKGCNPPTNDRFCPSGNVTRSQMAAFLHRALG